MMRHRAAGLALLVALAAPLGSRASLAAIAETRTAEATIETATSFADEDETPPAGAAVQTGNGASTPGRAEAGDWITFSFTEPVDPASILVGWDGTTTPVVVRIADGGIAADLLSVRNAGSTVQLPLGEVSLGGTAYVLVDRSFGASGTASTMRMSGADVTVVLGTPSGTTGTAVVGGSMTWTPTAGITDLAGNPCTAAPVVEADPVLADVEF